MVDCSRYVVASTYQRLSTTGDFEPSTRRTLFRLVRSDRRGIVSDIARNFNRDDGLNASEYAVHRTYLYMTLRSLIPIRVPMHTAVRRRQRI